MTTPVQYDKFLETIADYVTTYVCPNDEAYHIARHCLLDALGCGIIALHHEEPKRHIGPVVPGTVVPGGARVPGTNIVLDPIKATFDIGILNRWMEYNDTWLAAEWGHPSDNIAGILAVGDFVCQRLRREGKPIIRMRQLLETIICAYEIHGVIALANPFNRVGIDHVILVKIATCAATCRLHGMSHRQTMDALSNVMVDGHPLRTYRHAPNTGTRKCWAAGDMARRGVQLAKMVFRGEMGYPTAVTTPTYGFQDVLFKGHELKLVRPFASYVVEHILFKVSYPAEFHAQTAIECAQLLRSKIPNVADVDSITVRTQESAMRIINKTGPLNNTADRDHCLQYMVACMLIDGNITDDSYSDAHAADPRIDILRSKIQLVEDPQFSEDYLDPDKRSIANGIMVRMRDGTVLEQVVEYPLGHSRRRKEGLPLLLQKAERNLKMHYPEDKAKALIAMCVNAGQLDNMAVDEFMTQWVVA